MITSTRGTQMKLYLNYRGLTVLNKSDLPEGLTEFDCTGNMLTSLPELPSTLTHLNCTNNRLTCLPELPTKLTHLWCGYNQLDDLPELPSSLIKLFCGYNRLTSLRCLPLSLEALACGDNKLTSLPELPPSLQSLYCESNQLTELPNLPPELKDLGCYYNELSELPTLPLLHTLYANGNPFPVEYYRDGNTVICRLKSTGEINSINKVKKLLSAREILLRLVGDRSARNIQRWWKRYWWCPYLDERLNYQVSRYMLHYQRALE